MTPALRFEPDELVVVKWEKVWVLMMTTSQSIPGKGSEAPE